MSNIVELKHREAYLVWLLAGPAFSLFSKREDGGLCIIYLLSSQFKVIRFRLSNLSWISSRLVASAPDMDSSISSIASI